MTDDLLERINADMPRRRAEENDERDISILELSDRTINAFRRAFRSRAISITDVYKTFREVKRFPKKRWGLLPRIGPVAENEMRAKFREVLRIDLP